MGHIFISYSHKDTNYAHGLADHLKSMGLDIWIDERLDYGSQWPHEIQKQLDSCDAFLLIMTPRSFASDWVQSEVQRAKRKLKPIFPLLLEGDEPWLSVESTQYFDVRGGTFPDAKFYSALQRVMTVDPRSATFNRLPKPVVKTEPPRSNTRIGWIAALIGGIAIAICACTAMIGPMLGLIPRESSATHAPTKPETAVTDPALQSTETATVVLTPTFTLTILPTTVVPTTTATFIPTSTHTPTFTPTNTRTPTQTPTNTPTFKTYINVATGVCLDSNGVEVYPLTCNGGDFQNWDRQGQRLVHVATGLCLDSNGTTVYTLTCNGGNYQNWR